MERSTGRRLLGAGAVILWLTHALGPTGAGEAATSPTASAPSLQSQGLARLAPPSTAILVQVRNGARIWEANKDGALARNLKATALWRKFVASDAYARMTGAAGEMQIKYHFDPQQAFLDVLGTEAAVAFTLETGEGPGGSATRPAFYLLAARAVSAERLKAVVDQVRTIRADGGEVKSAVDQAYRGYNITQEVTVAVRGRNAGQQRTVYFCLADDLLLAGDRIGPVKAAIDRLLDPQLPNLGGGIRYQQALAALPAEADVTAYIDVSALTAPSDWAHIVAGGAKSLLLEALLVKKGGAVRAAETLAFGLSVKAEPQLAYRLRIDPVKLDPAARALLAGNPGVQKVWGILPANTVWAVCTRADLGKVLGWVRDDVLDPARAVQFDAVRAAVGVAFGGLDFDKAVLPQMGPEVALVVTREPVAAGGKGTTFVRGLAATALIQVAPEGDVPVRLEAALGTLASMAVLGNNADPQKPPLVVNTERVGPVSVTYVDFAGEHPLKGAISPCFARVGTYLVVSSSRAAMRDFAAAAAGERTPANGDASNRLGAAFAGAADQLSYVSFQQLAISLGDNRDLIVAHRRDGEPADTVAADVDALIEIVRLFQSMTATRTLTPGLVSGTITLAPMPAPGK